MRPSEPRAARTTAGILLLPAALLCFLSGKRVRSAPKATILRCLRARPLFDFAASPRLSPRLRVSASKSHSPAFSSPSITGSSVALNSAVPLLVVFALQGVATDFQKVQERREAEQQADLGAFHVVPSHRDFHGSKPKLLGDEKDFDVEAEAIQLLAGEDFAAGAGLEELEAALRILEWKSGDQAHGSVENTADRFAQPGLVHAHQRPVHRARSHGDL